MKEIIQKLKDTEALKKSGFKKVDTGCEGAELYEMNIKDFLKELPKTRGGETSQ